jgi:ubiquinone/menaquinone biosynthesis C-methylase UbiE
MCHLTLTGDPCAQTDIKELEIESGTELPGQMSIPDWISNVETPQPFLVASRGIKISIRNVGKSFPREFYIDNKYHYHFVNSNQFAQTYDLFEEPAVSGSSSDYELDLRKASFIRLLIDDPMLDSYLPLRLMVGIAGSHRETIEFRRRFNGFYTPTEMHPWQVEKFFDLIAGEYDNLISTELNASVFGALLKAARRQLPRQQGTAVVLDYGIGTGLASQQALKISGIRLIGVDISSEMLEICLQRGIEAKKCTYHVIPLHSGQIDIAICCFVAQYLFDETPYRQLHRVLKNGGILALNLHKSSDVEENHIRQMFNNTGFGKVKITQAIFKTDGRKRRIPIITGIRLPRFEIGYQPTKLSIPPRNGASQPSLWDVDEIVQSESRSRSAIDHASGI